MVKKNKSSLTIACPAASRDRVLLMFIYTHLTDSITHETHFLCSAYNASSSCFHLCKIVQRSRTRRQSRVHFTRQHDSCGGGGASATVVTRACCRLGLRCPGMDTQQVMHGLLHRASGDTKHCDSYPREFFFSMFAQVGVCGKERLPGEGGGHPVVGHHQAERCHDDQQL